MNHQHHCLQVVAKWILLHTNIHTYWSWMFKQQYSTITLWLRHTEESTRALFSAISYCFLGLGTTFCSTGVKFLVDTITESRLAQTWEWERKIDSFISSQHKINLFSSDLMFAFVLMSIMGHGADIKVIVHQKIYSVMNYSLSCCSKPVRPLFIFGTN